MKSNRMRALPVVVAAVFAGAGLTACSAPVQAGTAATVGGDRITTGRLDSEVREFQAALKTAKITEAQLQLPSGVPRAVLLQMISIRQFQQFAQRNGVTVSEREIADFLTEQGGMAKIGPAALSKGVPPSETREWVRTALIYQKSLQQFGANLTDQASVQAAQVKLFGQMDTIPVKVSHRYGTWDPQQGLVEEARFGKPAPGSEPTTQPDPAAGQ
ncbi:SurA N-terminal domain-containing protein [Sphaerisporangium corydalis]|uniref:SurA N-terminal domain-containing protein n=1 Tax=Sphaerisporangium corydalis TaxID=1441875 RepID=A0ABV9ED36_9ACTN|nr:SurA N-terminal domain-containing protein [Sphaerisporangium corydalis]